MPEPPSRIEAAILFTDIAGYTALMQRDEAGTLALLEKLRRALSSLLDRYDGRLIKDLGDGQLCIFEEAEAAVKSAVNLQQIAQNELRLPLRTGIHLGEITIVEKDIYGSAVNLAARIESFSVPGSVLISEEVYQIVKENPELPCRLLGKYQLKHVDRPTRLYAVASSGLVIPDPAKLSGKGKPADTSDNIPKPLTSFLGREREVVEVRELLEKSRLLTLTGTGGTGKTRLSLRIVEELREHFDDGACWVELAPVRDPKQLPFAIVQALGADQDAIRKIEEILFQFLRERKMLLVLDNFEQVIQGAPLVKQMLEHCPSVKILVTSRVPLGIMSEQEYAVDPLPLPKLSAPASLEQLKDFPSVALFVQRAQTVNAHFQLEAGNAEVVAQICVRLDGLPLAIELAAARTKIFPPKTLLERLSTSLRLLKTNQPDLPSRHQTLRQTISWSYNLLNEEEKKLFQRLSVFAGGSTLDAVEVVCSQNGPSNWDLIDGLAALTNKSLVRMEEKMGEPRYYMLETIREFARESLEDSGNFHRMGEAHAAYFLRLAEKAQPNLAGAGERRWLAVLEEDYANLKTAVQWCLASAQPSWAYRIGIALLRFWLARNMLLEGRETLENLLKTPLPAEEIPLRLKVLRGLGTLYMNITNYTRTIPIFEEILEIWTRMENAEEVAVNKNNLAWALMFSGIGKRAEAMTREALEYHEKKGNLRGRCLSLNNLGGIYFYVYGNPRKAIAYFEQSLTLREEIGDERGISFAKILMSACYNRCGDYERSKQYLKEAMAITRSRNDRYMINTGLVYEIEMTFDYSDKEKATSMVEEMVRNNISAGSPYGLIGFINFFKGFIKPDAELEKADELIEKGLQIMQKNSILIHTFLGRQIRAFRWLKNRHFENALRFFQDNLLVSFKHGNRVWFADSLELIGAILTFQDHQEKAARLLGKSRALRKELDAAMPPRNQPYVETALITLREKIGTKQLEALLEKGKMLDMKAALELAYG